MRHYYTRRAFLKGIGSVGLGVTALALPHRIVAGARTAGKPNIVFIMADDLGYGDLGCYNAGSKIPTPNIDLLARHGMRFTDAHAPAALCIPTRYGLLTGRYPFRMGDESGGSLIKPGRMTLGSLLQTHGYATACVGKWHLGIGGNKPDYAKPLRGGPVDRGFDYYFGIPRSLDQPPYFYIENDRCVEPPTDQIAESHSEGVTPIQGAFWRGGRIAPGFKHAEVLPTFTRKAVEYIDTQSRSSSGQPFFLYLALQAPHTPWMPAPAFQGKSKAGDYGDYAAQVDDTVGRVMKILDRHKLAENTLLFFTSDNGPVWYQADVDRYDHRAVYMLRGMKGDAWEGGTRMPFIARWPGRIRPGTVSDSLICHTDMLATFAALLGETLPDDAGEDSYNILPILLGDKPDRRIREAIVLESARQVLAIRQGTWKLIPQLGSGGFSQPQFVEPEPGGPQGQLYNLDRDIGEKENLWMRHPEIVERLTKLLEKYKREGRSVPRRSM